MDEEDPPIGRVPATVGWALTQTQTPTTSALVPSPTVRTTHYLAATSKKTTVVLPIQLHTHCHGKEPAPLTMLGLAYRLLAMRMPVTIITIALTPYQGGLLQIPTCSIHKAVLFDEFRHSRLH